MRLSIDPQPTDAVATPAQATPRKNSRRRKTSHLKIVPETKDLREAIRAECVRAAGMLDKSQPLGKDEMEAIARRTLDGMSHPEGYVAWTMVALASAFWQDQVAAVPPQRRLFLLPHCLKHAEGCPADYDQFGLDCKKCGACSIADFRSVAEDLGYKVLVAEGSPIVLKIIISGYVDAIIGVACLNVLEKAIDKILLAGIPCMAVPLLSSDCRNTSVDEEWVHEMVHMGHAPPPVQTRTYLHLMRAAHDLLQPEQLEDLAPRGRVGPSLAESNGHGLAGLDPVAATETIAVDFLAKGGKHSRPFITLAVYDALTGGKATLADGAEHLGDLPQAVKRTALAIETFHKASLVHDDIEDDDAYRYGDQTLHRKYGTPTAINVGDYIIGLGYRLVAHESAALGADVAADILARLADAHVRLSEGQGAELAWRAAHGRTLTPLDALKVYALKTAPAFEAALFCGARLAGSPDDYLQPFRKFAQNLGVAFQILNDLADWQGDDHNKRAAGGDVVAGRPTLLWALAVEALAPPQRRQLEQLLAEAPLGEAALRQVQQLYQAAGVFETAHRMVDKYQQRAEAVADEIEPDELRRLLYYLVDTVLERLPEEEPAVVALAPPSTSPVATQP